MPGRQWVIDCLATGGYKTLDHGVEAWLCLAASTLLASALAAFLLVLVAKAERNENLVRARTIELARANDSLRREVQERVVQETRLDEAKSAAEAANCAKSAFIANMSHEIRTPMTGILGFAEERLDPTR